MRGVMVPHYKGPFKYWTTSCAIDRTHLILICSCCECRSM